MSGAGEGGGGGGGLLSKAGAAARAKGQEFAARAGERLEAGKAEADARLSPMLEEAKVKADALLEEGKVKAAEVGGMALERVKEELKKVLAEIQQLTDELQKRAVQWAEEKRAQIEPYFEKQKKKMHSWLMRKLQRQLDRGLDSLTPKIKDAVVDPYMPRCLQNIIENGVDAMWPGIKEEIIDMILGELRPKPQIEDGPEPENCCRRLQAWLRYHLLPYDKSIWGCLRDPFFVFWRILQAVPLVGVLPFTYFVLLLTIDRKDEFQLVDYIVHFKGSQFVTIGVIRMLVGTILLYQCATHETQDCKEVWGWNTLLEIINVCFFISQVVMCWVAFCYLPSSEKKGSWHKRIKEWNQSQGIDDDDEEDQSSTQEEREGRIVPEAELPALGHHLMRWLIYDGIIFTLCLTVTLLAMFLHAQESARVVGSQREGGLDNNWRFTITVYMVQCLYGFFSFPFIIFLVPAAHSWFTHARPTAYTKNGLCVPYVGLSPAEREKMFAKQRKLAEERDAALCEDEDAALKQS
eukprot:TRINITY_DN10403_c0_g1_i1.p1 TRINITY_DN10403_c0_g1~~TRINITY_DN10403_c0_g1_i1.p1  ORF type:complete len:521 (+),score=176.92 TRINITY_DN10403_c0_g1_i1:100-1662(+)